MRQETTSRTQRFYHKTTINIPTELHNAAKAKQINITEIVTNGLTGILYGDAEGAQQEIQRLHEEIQGLQTLITSKQTRMQQLQNLIDQTQSEIMQEQKLYEKYLQDTENKVRPFLEKNITPHYDELQSYWKKQYFPNDGINSEKVEQICSRILQGVFSFDEWLHLRNKTSLKEENN